MHFGLTLLHMYIMHVCLTLTVQQINICNAQDLVEPGITLCILNSFLLYTDT